MVDKSSLGNKETCVELLDVENSDVADLSRVRMAILSHNFLIELHRHLQGDLEAFVGSFALCE